MADTQPQDHNPLPSDGWASRKLIVGVSSWLLLAIVATVALFTGFTDFGGWSGFLQWLTPGILLPLFGSMAVDKLAQAKAGSR